MSKVLENSNMFGEAKIESPEEAAIRLESLIKEIQKNHVLWICEIDDGDAVSIPVNVEYDEKDKRIYINANYP